MPRDVTVLLGDRRLPDATKVGGVFGREDLEAIERLRAALADLDRYRFAFFDDHARLLEALRAEPPEFVLNFCDTGYHNIAARELHVPALLELLDIPYSGSGPACLGLCFDKAAVRAIAADCGVAVPVQVFVAAGDPLPDRGLPLPAIVKPNAADGSFGITQESVVDDHAAACARIAALRALCPGQGILVQEFLDGAEYGVSLMGNPGAGFLDLPALEVDYAALEPGLPRILGYESKTLPDSPYWTQLRYRAAALGADQRARLVEASKVLFERLGCRDYARFDFRAGRDGVPRLLEVNPNPAWCWDGKLALMAGFAGMSYARMLGAILDAALTRAVAGR
jgi:D-alanine-D-alanine ligase